MVRWWRLRTALALNDPSSLASWGCANGSWPCRADRSVHCDESAGDTTGMTSLAAVVVCKDHCREREGEISGWIQLRNR